MFCPRCGMKYFTEFCPRCHAPMRMSPPYNHNQSRKDESIPDSGKCDNEDDSITAEAKESDSSSAEKSKADKSIDKGFDWGS